MHYRGRREHRVFQLESSTDQRADAAGRVVGMTKDRSLDSPEAVPSIISVCFVYKYSPRLGSIESNRETARRLPSSL